MNGVISKMATRPYVSEGTAAPNPSDHQPPLEQPDIAAGACRCNSEPFRASLTSSVLSVMPLTKKMVQTLKVWKILKSLCRQPATWGQGLTSSADPFACMLFGQRFMRLCSRHSPQVDRV